MPRCPGTNRPSGRRPTYIRLLMVSMCSACVASVPVDTALLVVIIIMYVSHSGIRKKKPALHLPTCPYAKNKEKLLPPLPQPKKKKNLSVGNFCSVHVKN